VERRRLISLALFLGCALAEAAAASARKADEAILLLQEAIRRIFGRNVSRDLCHGPPPLSDSSGYFPSMKFSMDDARVDEIPLAHVSLALRSVDPDPNSGEKGARRPREGKAQNLELLLSEEDLCHLLKEQSVTRNVRNLKIRLSKDTVHVSGRLLLGLLMPEAHLAAGFEITDDGRRIMFLPERVSAGEVLASQISHNSLPEKNDALVDLEFLARRYNLDIAVKWVRSRSGPLRMTA